MMTTLQTTVGQNKNERSLLNNENGLTGFLRKK